MILEELHLPYETSWVEAEDLKKEPYESVNPNGRVPGKPAASSLPNLHNAPLLLKLLHPHRSSRKADITYQRTAIKDPNTGITLWESGRHHRLPHRHLRPRA